jgi:hypothetical protein
MAGPFDVNAKRRYTELIRRGRPPALAAEDLGFSFGTIRKHMREDRDFADGVEAAALVLAEEVEQVYFDIAVEGNDPNTTRDWLRNRLPQRWRDTGKVIQHQLTGAGGGPIQIAAASTDALRAVLADPESRQEALAFAREMPAIEAEAHEQP